VSGSIADWGLSGCDYVQWPGIRVRRAIEVLEASPGPSVAELIQPLVDKYKHQRAAAKEYAKVFPN
jgi:hypothetical protein